MSLEIDKTSDGAQIAPGIVPAAKEDLSTTDQAVPLPIGLRDVRLSPEAATKVREILDDPSYPTHTGREMPAADPSVLLNKPAS